MDPSALPMGVMLYKLTPKAVAIATAILQIVKESTVIVTQLLQETAEVADSIVNGVVSLKEIPISEHYKRVQDFTSSESKDRALYMHNKSLIEVAGADLVHKLYRLIPTLKQDVLVNYPLLYISDNPKSSNDVLVGSKDSWSPLHQDLPLFCTSAILVLEGHKEFAVVQDDVAPSLRINLSSGCWNKPINYKSQSHPDLQSLVRATNGAIITLHAGDLMLMPPRVFHLARNCAPTVSCNFSISTMDNIPLAVAQTFVRIERCPRDVMHFDVDFAQLLSDCTKALLHQSTVKASSIRNKTTRKQLPRIQSILNNGVRLMEWYMTLQCIPNGWVEGFWGDLRNRLLDQLHLALPLHTRSGDSAAVNGAEQSAAAIAVEVGLAAAPESCTDAAERGPAAAAVAGSDRLVKRTPPAAPRGLSRSKMMSHSAGAVPQQQAQARRGRRGSAQLGEAPRRCTRSESAALAAAAAAAAPAATTPDADRGTEDEADVPPRKRARLMDGQDAVAATAVAQ